MSSDEARDRFRGARVARLATADAQGRPHLVPIVFALAKTVIYTAVDAKPKTTTALRRLANIAVNPFVSVLIDHYDEDWTRLWWARADGLARVLVEPAGAVVAVSERYSQYRVDPPPGPVVAIEVQCWSGWSGDSR